MRGFWRLKLDLWLQCIVAIGVTALGLWSVANTNIQLVLAGVAAVYLLILWYLRNCAPSLRAVPPVSVLAALGGVYLAEIYLMREAGGLSKQNELLRLRSVGQQVVPALPPATWYFEHFRTKIDQQLGILPLAGVSKMLTVYCNEGSGWTIYSSDEHGFRNPPNVTPSSADKNVALIGDSFVHGACVPDANTLSGVLRARGWQVKNYGMAGSGPLLELATLQEYVLPFNPSKIVWFFYEGNDFRDLASEISAPPIARYLTDGPYQRLIGRQRQIDIELQGGVNEIERSESWITFFWLRRLRTAFNLVGISHGKSPTDPIELVLPKFQSVLRRASQLIEASGSRMLFVYLPAPDRFIDDPRYYVGMEQQVMRIACDAGIATLSVARRLSDSEKPLQYFANLGSHYGHFNESGYAFVADLVHQSWNGAIGDNCTGP